MKRRLYAVAGLLVVITAILGRIGWAQDALPTLKIVPGDGRVYIEWSGSENAGLSYYELYRSVRNGYIRLDGTATSYTDPDLENGVTYYYSLVAVDGTGKKTEVAQRTPATPVDLAPAAPAHFSASGRDQEARLRWTSNKEYDLSHYLLYRSTTSDAPARTDEPLATLSVGDSVYVDTGLKNATMYYYRLIAVDKTRNRSEAAMVTAVPGYVPEGLVALSGDQTVQLRWNPNRISVLSHYTLYRTQTFKDVPAPQDSVARIAITDTLYMDTGLEYGRTYFYYLVIVDGQGYSNVYVEPVSAAPQDLAPLAPSGLTVAVGNRDAQIGWSPSPESDVAKYYLYRSGSSEGSIETGVPIAQMDRTQTSYSDPGLRAGTTYYYFMIAEDQGGKQSVRSPQVSATIPKPRYKARDLTFFLLASQFFLIPLGIAF